MKRLKLPTAKIITVMAFITFLITSCKKDSDSSDSSTDLTDAETAEVITDATVNGGLTDQAALMSAVVVPSKLTISCGESKDTSITKSGSRSNVSYQYSLYLQRGITCSNYVPSILSLSYSGANSYDASKMSSSDSSNGSIEVSQLQPSYSTYVLNGTYDRKGTQQSSVNQQRSITSNVLFTIANMTIDKTTDSIISGTADITFTCATSGGKTSSRGAILTFKGNREAILLLDNGNTYTITF